MAWDSNYLRDIGFKSALARIRNAAGEVDPQAIARRLFNDLKGDSGLTYFDALNVVRAAQRTKAAGRELEEDGIYTSNNGRLPIDPTIGDTQLCVRYRVVIDTMYDDGTSTSQLHTLDFAYAMTPGDVRAAALRGDSLSGATSPPAPPRVEGRQVISQRATIITAGEGPRCREQRPM